MESGYIVRVSFDTRDAGTKQTFGPFKARNAAEECVILLSGRQGVRSATIEEVTTDGDV